MTPFERNYTAKAIREIRNIVRKGHSTPQSDDMASEIVWMYEQHQRDFLKWLGFWLSLVLMGCLLFGCMQTPAHAEEVIDGYKVSQYVKAIYKAEGGEKARYAYGIRSIPYTSLRGASRICYNTVKHNIKRYKTYGYKRYPHFIQFLAARYCPTTGTNLSFSEKRLNQYWIKNVTYFLREA